MQFYAATLCFSSACPIAIDLPPLSAQVSGLRRSYWTVSQITHTVAHYIHSYLTVPHKLWEWAPISIWGILSHLQINSLSFVIKSSWVGVKPYPRDDCPFLSYKSHIRPPKAGSICSIVWGILLKPTLPGGERERANPYCPLGDAVGLKALQQLFKAISLPNPSSCTFRPLFLHRLSDRNSRKLKTFP